MTANIVLLFTGCWLHSFARKCGFIMFWIYIDIFVFALNVEYGATSAYPMEVCSEILYFQKSGEMTYFCGVLLLTNLVADKPAT